MTGVGETCERYTCNERRFLTAVTWDIHARVDTQGGAIERRVLAFRPLQKCN